MTVVTRYGILGPVEAWDGERRLPVGGPQPRALLAVLLLNANLVVPIDRLVAVLWRDDPPAKARSLVQGCVAGLRRVLPGGPLVTHHPGYLLRVAPDEWDLGRFEQLVVQSSAPDADPERSARLLREALALWRGPALGGVPVDSLRPEAEALEERRLAALEHRIEVDLQLDRHASLVGELRQLVRDLPLRERLWAQLMQALAGAGRPAEALATYQRLRDSLVEQLGLEPGAAVQRLYHSLRTGTPLRIGNPLRDGTEPAPLPVPAQLPAAPGAFTGRAEALKWLDELPARPGSATAIGAISGMAGVGKTALAVHWAHRSRDRFPDGQLYVNLSGFDPVRAPMEPAEAIRGFLDALQVSPQRIPVSLDAQAGLYRSLLVDRRMLVLLDNARDAEQVRPLLPGAAGCLVLVTSRNRLSGLVAADGAQPLELDLLSLGEARLLLARRLGAQRASAEPDAVEEIVVRCARLPLALAVAAGRAALRPHFPLGVLAQELREARTGLEALSDPDPAIDLRAALDVSYRTLSTRTARLYRLLGLYPGPDVDVYAAAALGDTTVTEGRRLLAQLLNAHLLQEPAPGRYAFHDLIRAHSYATTAGIEPDRRAAWSRLLDHYRHTASVAVDVVYPYERERRPRLPPARTPTPDLPDPGRAAAWLDVELPNLLAAARQAADGWRGHTGHLSTILHRHLRTRGRYHDAETLHDRALAVARTTGVRAGELDALNCLGYVHRLQGRHERALDEYGQALGIARAIGDRAGELLARNGLGYVHLQQGRNDHAMDHLGQALRTARAIGDRAGELSVLLGLGHVQRMSARPEPALDYFGQALAIARATRDRNGELNALRGLGYIHRLQGRHEQAHEDLGQALEIARAIGDRGGELAAVTTLGDVYRRQGRHEQAADRYQQALDLAREMRDRNWQFEALNGLGRLYHATGHPQAAVSHHRQALELASGLAQPTDQARAYDGLAHAHQALNQPALARQHWQHALGILTGLGVDHTEDEEADVATIRAHLAGLD